MEHKLIDCNACGGTDHETLVPLEDYSIVRCQACQLIFVNPIPVFDKDDFHNVSTDFYYTDEQLIMSDAKKMHSKKEFALQSARWNEILPAKEEYSLLDVGCGPGLFVHAAVQQGWKAVGCDIDRPLVDLGNQELGLSLEHDDLMNIGYPSESFDVVRFKYVLEHLPNPYEMLVETFRLLKPGGLVLIIVPNEDGFFNQMNIIAGRKKTTRWGTLTPPHHLHAFTPSTVTRISERVGLEPIDVIGTSPRNPEYSLFYDHGPLKNAAFSAIFSIGTAVGKGSVLVALARKPLTENAQ